MPRLAKYSCLAALSALTPLVACAVESPDPDGVAAFAQDVQSFMTGQVLGFEASSAWQGPGIVGTSTVHTEGAVSLAVRPLGHAVYHSTTFALAGMPRMLRFDLQIPVAPPRPFWPGAVQLYIDCAEAHVYNGYIGHVELGGRPQGQFTTLEFSVPTHLQSQLASGCAAAQVSIALDVAGPTGVYLLDNLRILTDLILHYAFDAGATDSSGYGRNGTLVGGATVTPNGRIGGALTLDGNSGFVIVPDGITDGLEEVTVATWINMAQDRAWSRIFDFGGAVGFQYLTPSMGNGQLRYSTFAGPGNEGTALAPSLPLHAWKHIAVTTRGKEYRVYIDGVEAAAALTVAEAPEAIGANNGTNWIGRSRFPDPLLAGQLDDFRIYDRVLSADQIRALANPQADYVSYRFDDDRGHTVADSSSQGKDGTIVGDGRFARGLIDGALELPGDGAHVELPAGIVAGCHDVTVSAWAKLHANQPWNRVFDFGSADLSSFMYLTPAGFGALGQEIHAGLITPRGVVDIGFPFIVPEHEWHHFAVVLQGTTLTLYFNGRPVASRAGVTTSPADMGITLRNYLGKSQFPDAPFDGKLDDIRIACRAYDPREIADMAHLPLGKAPEHVDVQGDVTDVHDPAMIAAHGTYYLYSTGQGLQVRTSRDLASWHFAGQVFATNPAWVISKFGDLPSLWAPDVTFFGGQYHLYYAASTFGSNHSCIGHATKANLASSAPWTDHGPLICSNDGTVDDWNAIDPHVVLDTAGTPWMSLGSFWSGIKLIQLTRTGERADGSLRALASPPSTAIEASYIVYRAPYYYLFASFDFCCQGANSSYNVRVGRSTSITGPYVDRTGLDMLAGGGTPVVAGDSRWAGPGSNAVVQIGDRWWNVYHTYDVQNAGIPTLRISELSWQDGWPVSGEP
ncbi:MAG TPA: LamG-like jellyroll fold domain-containing protein [Kofleriaceae bacterium]|nr:LamG-like jellyroll fold domain-containing protein [Kofleriaceae bacterium]